MESKAIKLPDQYQDRREVFLPEEPPDQGYKQWSGYQVHIVQPL